MSFDLSQAVTGKKDQPWMMWLYGQIGTGKSTLAAQLPNHVFLPTEDGLNFINEATVLPESKTLDDFLNWIESLITGDHEYKTAIIDGTSGLDILINKACCQEEGVTSINKIAYGGGKNIIRDKWLNVISVIERLKNERKMNVALLGHNGVNTFNDPEGAPYDEYVPRMFSPEARDALMDKVDFLLFAKFKVHKATSDIGFGKTESKGVGGSERILYTQNAATHWAKTRVAMDAQIDYTGNVNILNQLIEFAQK